MSSINNHNSGLTINIYNNPLPATADCHVPRGLTADSDAGFDIGMSGLDDGRSGSAIDHLPLPAWFKSALKSLLGHSADDMSSGEAAKYIRDFQKQNNIGLLGSGQLQEMADHGSCTLPNGDRLDVPDAVQAAAQKMMANNAELFKKLETAIRPEHDGLLSAADYDAALKDGSIGKPGVPDLPTVRGLDPKAFLKFVFDGVISPHRPLEYDAAKTIQCFQQQHNIKHLSIEQLQQMATSPYCTARDGKNTFQVQPDVQAAALTMLENNAELFRKLETTIRVDPDGLLSKEDVDQAVKQGLLGRNQPAGNASSTSTSYGPQTGGNQMNYLDQNTLLDLMKAGRLAANDAANGMPSTLDAVKALHAFQVQQNITLLSTQQLQEMIASGSCTMFGDDTVPVSPELQAAARKMMDNNGQLLKQLDAPFIANSTGSAPPSANPAAPAGPNANTPAGPSANNPANSPAGPSAPPKTEYASLECMRDFQKKVLDKDMLTRDKLQQMVDHGTVTKNNGVTADVPKDVQDAAKTLLANNGALFDQLEIHKAKKDGMASLADYDAALKRARQEPTNAMIAFQKSELKGSMMTFDMMKEIADSGKLTKGDGSKITVPQNVWDAARAYMDNDAKMFRDAESWQNNKHDNKLSVRDNAKFRDGDDGHHLILVPGTGPVSAALDAALNA